MLPEYSHTKSESLVQISTPMAETQFFLGDCFLLAHPVCLNTTRVSELQTLPCDVMFTYQTRRFVSENTINYAVNKVLMMNVIDIWMDLYVTRREYITQTTDNELMAIQMGYCQIGVVYTRRFSPLDVHPDRMLIRSRTWIGSNSIQRNCSVCACAVQSGCAVCF